MTLNYKILGQLYYGPEYIEHPEVPGSGSGYGSTPGTPGYTETLIEPQVLYTAPANTQTTVTSIYITNHDSVERTYDIAVVPATEVLGLKHHIRWDMPVLANDFDLITSKLTLSAGDRIYVFPSTINKVGFTAFGVEQ